MTDPIDTTPRRRRIWPLAAMATLVGLLATYLIVQANRSPDDTPEVVHTPPTAPPPTAPKTPEVDPADRLLQEAEAALKEGRWDEAAKKAELAKPARAEAAAALLARIDDGRKQKLTVEETRAAEAEKKRQEEAAAKEKERR